MFIVSIHTANYQFMKIRIRGNSLRFRLLQSEVAELNETGKVSETIRFGSGEKEILRYTLQSSEKAAEISAGFCSHEICIVLPADVARVWAETDLVSLENEQNAGDETLKILVEKDFVCLTRTDDPDNRDAFPNPEADC